MAKLKPLKKPTRTKKPVSSAKKATPAKKKPAKKSVPKSTPKDRPTIAARAKSGTFGMYDWDPGSGTNKRRSWEGQTGGYGAYGHEKGNITYKHLGETVKKTTKSRKKPGPKKR